jgi:hypothetical protein
MNLAAGRSYNDEPARGENTKGPAVRPQGLLVGEKPELSHATVKMNRCRGRDSHTHKLALLYPISGRASSTQMGNL